MQKALPLDRGHRLHVHKTIGNIHKTFICSTYVLCPGVYGAFTVNFKYVQECTSTFIINFADIFASKHLPVQS